MLVAAESRRAADPMTGYTSGSVPEQTTGHYVPIVLNEITRWRPATCVSAQEHPWTGRTLDGLEQTIHERLAQLPHHGVFDTVNFEVQGKTVVLSGYVMKETVAEKAERAVMRLDGVENVVNHIEVLPSSRRDDALRKNIYRAVFEGAPGPGEGPFADSDIHIIVKNGWSRWKASPTRIRIEAAFILGRRASLRTLQTICGSNPSKELCRV